MQNIAICQYVEHYTLLDMHDGSQKVQMVVVDAAGELSIISAGQSKRPWECMCLDGDIYCDHGDLLDLPAHMSLLSIAILLELVLSAMHDSAGENMINNLEWSLRLTQLILTRLTASYGYCTWSRHRDKHNIVDNVNTFASKKCFDFNIWSCFRTVCPFYMYVWNVVLKTLPDWKQ